MFDRCDRRTPSPLVGEGWGGGDGRTFAVGVPPTPNPSPQGGGESAVGIITLAAAELQLDASGALFWPAERALLVADLHLEKGAAHAAHGALLPPYDTRETLARLAEAIARIAPARVIALGDSFHAGAGARLGSAERALLRELQAGREWIWLAGNHDPEVPAQAGGEVCTTLALGGIALRHVPGGVGTGPQIAGHMHPAARLAFGGHSVRRRCFVGDGQCLVMPAFGAFAGGLNVLDQAFAPLLDGGRMSVWMLGSAQVYPVATRHLRGD